jgi:hypothetical protein
MDRSNHYEAAFEAYLQSLKVTCIAVDETKRSQLGPGPVKSLDFIVHGEEWKLLVDIKGRRYPGGSGGKKRHVWECWSTQEDVSGLTRWVELFGPEYRGLLVFAYQLADDVAVPDDSEDLWSFRESRYLYRAVPVEEYQKRMKVRSPKWGTVTLPGEAFRELVRPLSHFLRVRPESACDPSRELSAISVQLSARKNP